MIGPGKYDDLCTEARTKAKAEKGSGHRGAAAVWSQRMTIWKFRVPVLSIAPFSVRMPKDARILTVQMQPDEGPVVWAIVDEAQATEPRSFVWRGTGGNMADVDPDQYVGTVQFENGSLVFHLFEHRP